MKHLVALYHKHAKKGFILPLTLLVCTIILTIATGISVILAKELYFSQLSRQSQYAYYAADVAMTCATTIEAKYVEPTTGLGIFPYGNDDGLVYPQAVLDQANIERQYRNLSTLTLNDIKCATAPVFDTSVSGFTTAPFTRTNSAGNVESGKVSTFSMHMDLGDGTSRCATVLVYKTSKYRQIIARGFTSCGALGTKPIERAIVSTTELQ